MALKVAHWNVYIIQLVSLFLFHIANVPTNIIQIVLDTIDLIIFGLDQVWK